MESTIRSTSFTSSDDLHIVSLISFLKESKNVRSPCSLNVPLSIFERVDQLLLNLIWLLCRWKAT